MKHVHCDKIVAKAENMDLVLFNKSEGQDCWNVSHETCLPVFSTCEYFLCLPQHKEACLHWLNGGTSQHLDGGKYQDITSFDDLISKVGKAWSSRGPWMDEDCKTRIKPKKEKRWIIWNENQDKYHCTFLTNPDGIYEANFKFSAHEIEVEV